MPPSIPSLAMSFKRLVRFIPKGGSSSALIGEPVDSNVDVGVATRKGQDVDVRVFSGQSALEPGSLTDKVEKIGRLLSPLTANEVGTIRCIGLNVSVASDHTSSIADWISTNFMRKKPTWNCQESQFFSCTIP